MIENFENYKGFNVSYVNALTKFIEQNIELINTDYIVFYTYIVIFTNLIWIIILEKKNHSRMDTTTTVMMPFGISSLIDFQCNVQQ